MKALLNATSHLQEPYRQRYLELGWEVENQPRLQRVGPSTEELNQEAERLANAIPEGSCVLIGGLTYLCDALSLRLLPRKCRLYCALTHRISDDRGNYIFTGPSMVVETPLSRWWHETHP